MALVDPNIAMSYRGIELPNQLAQYGQVQQIQNAQSQNRMADLQMKEYERARTEAEGLRNYLSGADLASPEARAGLARFGEPGLKYGKALTEQDTVALTQRELRFKVEKAKTEFMSQALRDISKNPSDANLTAYMEDLAASPLFSAEEKAGISSTARRIFDMPIDQRGAFMMSQGAGPREPRKPVPPPAKVAEYQYAKTPEGGGYQGTFQRFTEDQARAGRAPVQPRELREPSAPIAVVDPTTGRPTLVTRDKAIGMTPAASMEGLPPKEIQRREATYPQATSSIKGFETKSDFFIRDLEKLRDDAGLENITGPIFGRTGSVTREGSRAQALYDKVIAKGGFQALQDMRDASKTGGALGNVSNQEGKQLQASVAAIDRRQNAEDVRAAINQLIEDIQGSKSRVREAYDTTYEYKNKDGAAPVADPLGIR